MAMNYETVKRMVLSMGTMKFFPADPVAQLALVELMTDLTDDEEKVRWLVKRVRTLYNEWPGEREVRAVFCSRFRPADGEEAHSAIFPQGIPKAHRSPNPLTAEELRRIGAAEPKIEVPAGGETTDQEFRDLVRQVSAKKGIPPVQ